MQGMHSLSLEFGPDARHRSLIRACNRAIYERKVEQITTAEPRQGHPDSIGTKDARRDESLAVPQAVSGTRVSDVFPEVLACC